MRTAVQRPSRPLPLCHRQRWHRERSRFLRHPAGVEPSRQCEAAAPAVVPNGLVPARHGDTLRITVDGVQGSVDILVDAEGPEFSEISPEDSVYLGSTSVKFRFVVTDEDSGLRHDGELDYTRGDLDARAFNMDDDQFTNGEPRSMADGAAEDIDVRLGGTPLRADGDNGDDMSKYGSSGWSQRGGRAGVSYFLDMAVSSRLTKAASTGT